MNLEDLHFSLYCHITLTWSGKCAKTGNICHGKQRNVHNVVFSVLVFKPHPRTYSHPGRDNISPNHQTMSDTLNKPMNPGTYIILAKIIISG